MLWQNLPYVIMFGFFFSWTLHRWPIWLIYRDKSREKQRKKNLQTKKEAEQREQKSQKPKATTKGTAATTVTKKKTAKQRRAAQSIEDDDEMAMEYRLLKKLKKGAINESEFAKLTGTEELFSDD